MNRSISIRVLVFLAVAFIATPCVQAVLIRGIDIDFVTIGNPGNPGDTRTDYPNSADPYGCGSVDYVYHIGKYEVTNAQWDVFVAAASVPTGNPSDAYDESAYWTGDNIPTNAVSWYEAAQFCNYLTSGDKSDGAYQFSGDNSNPGDFEGINRDSAMLTYGIVYVIPTEDEWYKAAYYTGSGYSTHANGIETPPIAGDDTNYDYSIGQPWDVGVGTQEHNGTYDMMGNVDEWNETLIFNYYRGLRGGSCYGGGAIMGSSFRGADFPYIDYRGFGFRVASIPEPTTLLLLGLGAVMVRRRK